MSEAKDRRPHRLGIESRTGKDGVERHRGTVWDKKAEGMLRGPWTTSLAEARGWRVDAQSKLRSGELSADRGLKVSEAVDWFIAGIEDGSVRNRSGRRYRPGPIAEIRRALHKSVVPEFGSRYLAELTLPDVQLWADGLAGDDDEEPKRGDRPGEGLAPNTIRNIVNALRSLYGWALPRGYARINPTRGLRLATGEVARDRIASPQEAAKLIAALPDMLRAFMGLAVYAGLRLGEILALDWGGIDLEGLGTIEITRSWDYKAKQSGPPKSEAGIRTVPITHRLLVLLRDHRVLTNHRDGLLFPGQWADVPIHPTTVREKAAKAITEAELAPLGFHEARHTAASIFIAAGLNAKTVSTYLGHASISITYDRYGHLFPGNEAEARGLLDAFLA